MILTEQKDLQDILYSLKDYTNIFLVGCGECATTCNTGGEKELLAFKELLEKENKVVTGFCVPQACCVAAKLKQALASQMAAVRQAQAVVVFACGLGVQSFKDNDRTAKPVFPGCNSLSAIVTDAQGNFTEKCSLCGQCMLAMTAGICPVTLCPKGLLNGPCGGMSKGKCELDRDRDCAWVLIYQQMEKNNKLNEFKQIQKPLDHKKRLRPHIRPGK